MELVKTALASFGAGSAVGLFGYRPSLLQQCLRAESFSFLSALTAVVNQLASGRAPLFLQPFLAGRFHRSREIEQRRPSVMLWGSDTPIGGQVFLYWGKGRYC